MGGQASENQPCKRLCAGLLAHVDSGKTTLSEAMLYQAGALRKLGRVDHRDAFFWIPTPWNGPGASPFSPSRRCWSSPASS